MTTTTIMAAARSESSKKKPAHAEVITLTLGDCAENGVGMQKITRTLSPCTGFTQSDFEKIQKQMEEIDVKTEYIELSSDNLPYASVLVIRNGVNTLLGESAHTMMFEEQKSLEWDKKKRIYGRVVNSVARYNLCFSEESQEPDYFQGKGRIVAFHEVPLLNRFLGAFEEMVGEKGKNLSVEGNYYYDITTCGIGGHGDMERTLCAGVRLGTIGVDTPIFYQWYKNGEKVGNSVKISLYPGDIYFMSEKAVGKDWKRTKMYTLRHATGAAKYTQFK